MNFKQLRQIHVNNQLGKGNTYIHRSDTDFPKRLGGRGWKERCLVEVGETESKDGEW